MTRINCIPPKHLLDQHLLAEYNETAMVFGSLKRSKATGRPLPKRDKYTLNTGHVTFFYDKGAFLKRRYDDLKRELTARKFVLDPTRTLEWDAFLLEPNLMNNWHPTIDDQLVNVERILTRFAAKPTWYKYNRKPVYVKPWVDLYSNWKYDPC